MLDFLSMTKRREAPEIDISPLVRGFSIEVMPRTAAKVPAFGELLPLATRVYIAHIEGTPIDDMVATARRLREEGMVPMPHIPARLVAGKAMLTEWLARYRDEAGVEQALLLAGGAAARPDHFASSMDMMATGLFDRYGFKRLHVAGHPEGNRDIDANGGTALVDDALRWKADFADRTDAEMAIVTQFAFEAKPVLDWIARLRAAGIALPVHVGLAGPAKLQTLIKYAATCGVGASLKVLQRRALDVSRLMVPYEPTDVIADIARAEAAAGGPLVGQLHFFPFGGIAPCAAWARDKSAGAAPRQA